MNEIQLNRIDLNLLVTFAMLMETGSVALAASRLGKTPSAVSHALARLRDQVGDPLMVKVGGRMQPSPFAIALIEEVRPILRSIKRILTPPRPFDPATSDRIFRIAMPTIPKVIAAVTNRVAAEAPGVRLEWMPPYRQVYPALGDGLIDLAHLGGEPRLPDGLDDIAIAPFSWVTFARRDHPALADWGLEAWRTWPHLQVNVTRTMPNPFEEGLRDDGVTRRIGALIADSSGVAAILAGTDMLGTFPALLLAWDMEVYGLRALKPPLDLAPVLVRFFWSSRLANDPGSRWLRTIVVETYVTLQDAAEDKLRYATRATQRQG